MLPAWSEPIEISKEVLPVLKRGGPVFSRFSTSKAAGPGPALQVATCHRAGSGVGLFSAHTRLTDVTHD